MKRIATLLLLLSSLAWSQNTTATLVGTVTDTAGAAVASAKIAVTNQGTQIAFQTTTNDKGDYVVVDLAPGVYEVKVEVPGFQPVRITDLRLLANTTRRVDARVQPGAVQESITVTAPPPTINSETSSLTYTMDAHALSAVPLNQRTIDRFVKLIPGNASDWSYSNPSLSGSTYWGGTVFTLDGIQYNDTGNGGASYSGRTGLSTFPSLDALQEFKAETLNAKAEFAGSAAVSMITKSGTNQFHGSLFEFNRNRELTARSYFSAANSAKPQYNRNEFGGSIGGAIIKNKLFFFGAYEGLRQRTATSVSLILGTGAMREGDFAGLSAINDPSTGAPFPNNRIPTSRLDPRVQTVLKGFVPLPNTAGTGAAGTGYNYRADLSNKINVERYNTRLDYNHGSKDAFSFLGAYSTGSPYEVPSGSSPSTYGNYSDCGYTTQSLTFNYNRTIGPRTLNEFRYAYMSHSSARIGQNKDFNPSTLFPQITYPRNFGGLPTFSISNYSSVSDLGGSAPGPEITQEITDNFTFIRGSHTFKTGLDFALSRIASHSTVNGTLGSFSFNGRYSGNAYADFLLGDPVSSSVGSESNAYLIYWARYAGYFQDDWKISRKLTLNLGVRYDLQTSSKERDGQMVGFDFASGKAIIRTEGGQLPKATIMRLYNYYTFATSESVGWGSDMILADRNNFAPRFGFAYRPFADNKTVIRGGYGIYYAIIPQFIGLRNLASSLPFVISRSYTADSTNVPSLTLANPFPGDGTVGTLMGVSALSDRTARNTYSQQYNVTIERELPTSIGLRLSFVGNQGRRVPIWNNDVNKPAVMVSGLQAHRPYQPYANVTTLDTSGSSSTHQLQVGAFKHFHNSLYFNFSYTLSKMLTDVPMSSGPQNPYARYLDRGNSEYIHRHALYGMATYTLPFGPGQKFLNLGGIGGKLLGNWDVVTMMQWLSGAPMTVTFSPSADGWFATRANVVSGQSLYASTRTRYNYLNPNAFSIPAQFTFGNSSRNCVFGPGYLVPDIGIHRSIAIHEGIKMEIRGDAFNFLNHAGLSNPATNLSSPSTFGKITSVAVSARVIQLGAKLTF